MIFKDKNDIPELLPTTVEGLDLFVADIIKEYGLPDHDDTYDTIATMIMHMPQSACRAPKKYFGESVLKSMANKVAYDKLKIFAERRKAKEEEAKLKTEAMKKLTEAPDAPNLSVVSKDDSISN